MSTIKTNIELRNINRIDKLHVIILNIILRQCANCEDAKRAARQMSTSNGDPVDNNPCSICLHTVCVGLTCVKLPRKKNNVGKLPNTRSECPVPNNNVPSKSQMAKKPMIKGSVNN